MKKRFLGLGILTIILSTSLIFTAFDDKNDFETSKNLDIYYSLIKELNLHYVDDIDAGELVKTSIDKMLESLDPYTNFYPESKIEDYKFMTTGQYGGVGAMIRVYNKEIVIAEVYKDFPAYKAGLKAGDAIISIAGVDTKGKTTEDISEMMKGQPGTTFTIKVKSFGSNTIVSKEITREKIQIKNVPYYGMLEQNVGYIVLTSFTENAAEEVKTALNELKNKGAQKIIFDLRGNPGGLLHEAVKIANLFVDKGQEIVSTRGKFKKFDTYHSTSEKAVDATIPLVVLVNRGSASASEIVSGAIQDLDRGIILGQRTFGKGLVQSTYDLSYNTKLKVTTAKYYIPSGRCIQALDYSHRNEDGSVGKIPDSLKTRFSTKGGRAVFDGGGVQPDIELDEAKIDPYVIQLMSENILFDFANEYCTKHTTIAPASTFHLTQQDIAELKTFVDKKNISYKTETESYIEELEKTAKNENYLASIKPQLDAMNAQIKIEKTKEFDKNSNDIVMLLETEIATRYYYQQGAIESQINDDPEVKKAISILQDSNLYNNVLQGQAGTHKKE